jgi:hypothetical protein
MAPPAAAGIDGWQHGTAPPYPIFHPQKEWRRRRGSEVGSTEHVLQHASVSDGTRQSDERRRTRTHEQPFTAGGRRRLENFNAVF